MTLDSELNYSKLKKKLQWVWTIRVLNNVVPNRQAGNYHINYLTVDSELHYSKLTKLQGIYEF